MNHYELANKRFQGYKANTEEVLKVTYSGRDIVIFKTKDGAFHGEYDPWVSGPWQDGLTHLTLLECRLHCENAIDEERALGEPDFNVFRKMQKIAPPALSGEDAPSSIKGVFIEQRGQMDDGIHIARYWFSRLEVKAAKEWGDEWVDNLPFDFDHVDCIERLEE